VGALLRIARALGKPATYFVEEEELPTVSVVKLHERTHHAVTEGDRTVAGLDFLTTGIPAGRLRVTELTELASGPLKGTPHEGEEIVLVTAGAVRVVIGESIYDLTEGDCIQFRSTLPHRFEKLGIQEPKLLWITASEGLVSP
jgi:mannose-6-phosphate isomerase-like protein (cupin superfamily)